MFPIMAAYQCNSQITRSGKTFYCFVTQGIKIYQNKCNLIILFLSSCILKTIWPEPQHFPLTHSFIHCQVSISMFTFWQFPVGTIISNWLLDVSIMTNTWHSKHSMGKAVSILTWQYLGLCKRIKVKTLVLWAWKCEILGVIKLSAQRLIFLHPKLYVFRLNHNQLHVWYSISCTQSVRGSYFKWLFQ